MDPALLAKRNIFITTSVADAPLVFEAMTGQEMLGRPFTYHVDLLSDSQNIDLRALLGERMTVHVEGTLGVRCFDGIITEFRAVGASTHFFRYRATLQPEVALLAYRSDCRIFQALSLKEIVLRVLAAGAVTVDGSLLRGTYNPVEYVVQYRESDLDFVSRLMEQAGIYYTFKHESGKHTMVLLDDTGACKSVPGYEAVPFFDATGGQSSNEEHLFSWSEGARIVPGQFTVRGYRYDTRARTPTAPANTLIQNTDGSARAGSDAEVYDYAAFPVTDEEARGEALRRLQEHETWLATTQAEGDTRGVGVGHKLKVHGLGRSGADQIDFLVVRAGYTLTVQPYEADVPHADHPEYHASYTMIDSARGYRSPCDTPRPRVAGPQTATVVGHKTQAADEEICTDEQDRVLVKFNWDRRGEPNRPKDPDGDEGKDQSCFVRVSQVWAGSGWGAMYLPRIGHEVIVEFLEGDPDRPIVTGRVYNATNPPPYPKNPTQSGIKSRSTKGAGPNNFNEIRFDDKKGSEELHLQAERDQSTYVKRNQSISVDGDRSLSVGGNESVSVTGTRTSTIHRKDKLTCDAERELWVTGTDLEDVTGHRTEKDHGGREVTVEQGDALTVVGSDKTDKIHGKYDVTADTEFQVMQGANKLLIKDAVDVDSVGEIHLHNPQSSVDLKDGVLKITSASEIVLECGSSKISLKADGTVEINGSKVSANGGGSGVELSAAAAKMSGTKATVSGAGITEITGGIVKIN
ncbi:MAG: type VI secretion system Vgr family protein [Polyangia bacterium]